MNPLHDYFENNEDRLIHKWMHYFDIYHRHFERFRGQPVNVVEFGVFQGGSLQMWRDYFGPAARIWGIDIDPRCAALSGPGITVRIGDQENREFLKTLREEIGPIHVLIEDGGHTMRQQIATFEETYPAVVSGGVYLVEDLHTSYWPEYGGGFRHPGTFIEYAKPLIDQFNAWHSRDPSSFPVTDFTRTTKSMHVYDSIIVFEKGEVATPHHRMTGQPSWPIERAA